MGLWEMLKGEQPGIIRSILNYENLGQFGEYSTEFALKIHNTERQNRRVFSHPKAQIVPPTTLKTVEGTF